MTSYLNIPLPIIFKIMQSILINVILKNIIPINVISRNVVFPCFTKNE